MRESEGFDALRWLLRRRCGLEFVEMATNGFAWWGVSGVFRVHDET
jgi:Fe-S oxidoreductase